MSDLNRAELEYEIRQVLQEEVDRAGLFHTGIPSIMLRIAGRGLKKQRSSFSLLPKTGIAWVIAILILLLLAGGFAVATSKMSHFFDRLVPGISETELVTDLDMSKTIDGVTVTLKQAYADPDSIVIGYSYSTNTTFSTASYLTSADSELPLEIQRGFGRTIPTLPAHESWESVNVIMYHTDLIDTSVDQLDLQFEFILIDDDETGAETGKRRDYVFTFTLPVNRGDPPESGWSGDAQDSIH